MSEAVFVLTLAVAGLEVHAAPVCGLVASSTAM